ncbi:DUF134 domain-containing protein [Thermoproteota archaeon]
MPFQKKQRFCRPFQGATLFKPKGIPMCSVELIVLYRDELEAIHLCDYEGLSQMESAEKMKISTGTLQRILYSGRKKVADALFSGKALKIIDHDYIK